MYEFYDKQVIDMKSTFFASCLFSFSRLNYLWTLIFFTSCNPTFNWPSSPKPLQPAGVQAPEQGTGDSGGGNSYKGKPLESYIFRPTDLPAVQKLILPTLEAAADLDVAAPIKGSLFFKTWYRVPGPLKALPSEMIGSAVKTEQAALQDFRQVWIDDDLFSKMSEREQAQLILHEMLMSLKLQKFTSPREACLSDLMGYNSTHYTCDHYSTERLGTPNMLTITDYQQIRQTTDKLLGDTTDLKTEMDWQTLMNIGNFHYQQIYFSHNNQRRQTEYSQNFEEVIKNLNAGYKPQYGYSITELDRLHPDWSRDSGLKVLASRWNSHTTCSLQATKNENSTRYAIIVEIGTYKRLFEYTENRAAIPPTFETINIKLHPFGNRMFEKMELISSFQQFEKPVGQHFETLTAYKDPRGRIVYFEVAEWYRSSQSGNRQAWDDQYLKGNYRICSLEPFIMLEPYSAFTKPD